MNLGKYILQLLSEYETVIIPGLGAFIQEYRPAQIDENSGEIAPPSKTVFFHSKIKSDDHLLVGIIARNEQIPVAEARKKIEEAREQLFFRLDQGEKVHLENIGTFFYDENRQVQFEYSGEINLLDETFGLENSSIQNEPEETVPDYVPLAGITAGKNAEPEPEPAVSTKGSDPSQEKPPGKKRNGWWWIFLLIPLIAAAAIFFLKKQDEREKTEVPEINRQMTEQVTPSAADTLVADTIPTDSVTADSASILPADSLSAIDESFILTNYTEPDTSKFYVIGGSFENARNAEYYVRRMKKQGYSPVHLGKHGSYYFVALEIHDNKVEAYGAQYNLLDKFPDSGIWVYIPK